MWLELVVTLGLVAQQQPQNPQNPQDPQDPQRPPASSGPTLPTVVVRGRADDLVGIAASASEGVVGQQEIERRPLLRPGEVLETVPGVIVTQHSSPGKSNQQFARGFNLDHGTDLRTSWLGIPLNMPSHGHGQGYTDLGPLIPELVDTVRWRMGPYDVRDGDFASVGSIDIDYRRRLEHGFVKVTGGSYDFLRTVAADSAPVGDGHLLAAVELQSYDGPFAVDQDYRKRNGLLSWACDELRVSAFAYEASWTATDQIPRRAVRSGALGRFDSLDPTSGGQTRWFGTVAEWAPDGGRGGTLTGYVHHYDFDLFSNFTYFADDPVAGDQIAQQDRRLVFGGSYEREVPLQLADLPGSLLFGADVRGDRIQNGLFDSAARVRTATVRTDRIRQYRAAVFASLRVEPFEWLRANAGVRFDQYWFDVESDLAANSGTRDDGIVSGKGGVAIGPFGDTELYANVGTGIHSNDARGVLQRDDPATPTPLDGAGVDPLVQSRGVEVGLRTTALAGLQSTVSLWTLELDQELVFVGDAGSTEATRASRRYGIEWANHYRPCAWLEFDVDATWARGRYRDDDPAGDRIPGAVPVTVAAGVAVDWSDAVRTALRVRHFGRRPLIEDASVRSMSTTLVNARAAWQLDERRELQLDVLNLLDQDASDVSYFYQSRLAGEAAPVDDVHFHPVEPLSLRLSFVARF